jgi:hypothetical protein
VGPEVLVNNGFGVADVKGSWVCLKTEWILAETAAGKGEAQETDFTDAPSRSGNSMVRL